MSRWRTASHHHAFHCAAELGLTKCGVCGSGFIMTGAHRLSCFGARDKGICDNRLTIRRDEVEGRVHRAMQDKLLNQELFEAFCDEFTREMNRLRMQQRAELSAAEREIDRIEARRKKLVESIMDGIPVSEVRDELTANALRREVLKAKLAAADEPPPLLHPEMAQLYRAKVQNLAKGLEQPDCRTEATEALRGLVDGIVLTPRPDGRELGIELKGNLAAMLGRRYKRKGRRKPATLWCKFSWLRGPATAVTWRPGARPPKRRLRRLRASAADEARRLRQVAGSNLGAGLSRRFDKRVGAVCERVQLL
jgi:site-specific DNA recombinase